MVKKVKNTIQCVSSHLKTYQIKVWNLISKFISFNISSNPRSSNTESYLLANVASKLLPTKGFLPNSFSVEMIFRLSIPDNITNWRVFDDDQQIINFFHMENTFQGVVIDDWNFFMIYTKNLKGWLIVKQIFPPCNMKL